jgi:chromosome segregation ATPase
MDIKKQFAWAKINKDKLLCEVNTYKQHLLDYAEQKEEHIKDLGEAIYNKVENDVMILCKKLHAIFSSYAVLEKKLENTEKEFKNAEELHDKLKEQLPIEEERVEEKVEEKIEEVEEKVEEVEEKVEEVEEKIEEVEENAEEVKEVEEKVEVKEDNI